MYEPPLGEEFCVLWASENGAAAEQTLPAPALKGESLREAAAQELVRHYSNRAAIAGGASDAGPSEGGPSEGGAARTAASTLAA